MPSFPSPVPSSVAAKEVETLSSLTAAVAGLKAVSCKPRQRKWTSVHQAAPKGYPHHLGQHQTHHFRQHPEITHSSHFGRSLWATQKTSFLLTTVITRVSHLGFGWGRGEGSFYLHHYLIQPFQDSLGGGREGSFYLHHCLTQPVRVWLGGGDGSFYLHHCLTQPCRVWLSGWGGILLLTSLLHSAI